MTQLEKPYSASPETVVREAEYGKNILLAYKVLKTLFNGYCGWNALVHRPAKHYSVIVHGVTLNEQQYHYAQQCILDQRFNNRVSIDMCDYRDLPEGRQYDRIASVGKFEHVGVENFSQYFGRVKSLLKPGGLLLTHGIISDTGWKKTDLTRFINNYLFPGGELARISDVCQAIAGSR